MATPEDPKRDSPLDHHHNSAPRKLGPSTANTSCRPTVSGAAAAVPPDQLQPPPAPVRRCPRCDSTNTKFCYYNNYSLSQPRHFCKTCRRYWTKGGALRNVPIGGGCRKNKKLKSSSSSSSIVTRLSSAFDHHPKLDNPGTGTISPSSSALDVPGFRFFPPSLSPPVDFQLSGISSAFDRLPIPFSPYPDSSNYNSRFALEPPVGFSGSYPSLSSSQSIPSGLILSNFTTQEMPGSLNIQSNLASSIESLSSLNQDLHRKLQQQRLAMLIGPVENQNDAATFASSIPSTLSLETQVVHKPQPHPFQNQEFMPVKSDNACSRKESTGEAAATEWFFGNSYNSFIPNSMEDAGNGNRSVQTWGDGSNQHEFGAN